MFESGQLRKEIAALENGNDALRKQTIQSLRSQREEDWAAAQPTLVQNLIDSLLVQISNGAKPAFMPKEVAIILGNIGPRSKPAVRGLIQLLHESNADPVRESAAFALGRIGKDASAAIDPLVALLSNRAGLAIQAVRALGAIGCADKRVRSALIEHWMAPVHTQTSQIRLAITLCKLKIEARGLREVLIAAMTTSQDIDLRKSAADGLGWCNKNEADVVPALFTAATSDKHEEVRNVAQASLERLGLTNEAAVLICAKQLKSSAMAETALKKSGALAIPALIKALGDPTLRVKASRTLACLGEAAAPAVPALTTALRDRSPETRLAVAKALWHASKNADAVVPVLIELLEEKPAAGVDPDVNRQFLQTVMEALWRIGPPAVAARRALLEKAKSSNRMISESAQNALRKIMPDMPVR